MGKGMTYEESIHKMQIALDKEYVVDYNSGWIGLATEQPGISTGFPPE